MQTVPTVANDIKNRELHELLGKRWYRYSPDDNPDYAANPLLVLREMKRIGRLAEFLLYVKRLDLTNYPKDLRTLVDFVLNITGRLRDLAIEFLKGVGR